MCNCVCVRMCVLTVFSERPRYTAARECYEETLGILGETDHLASLLDNCAENNVFEVNAAINNIESCSYNAIR